MLAIVVLGGLGSQLGVALAALAMIGGFELFRGFEQFRMLAFGGAMVLLMIWRPRGLELSRSFRLPQRTDDNLGGAGQGRPMNAEANILDVQHLSMRFGGIVAVNDLSFTVKRGDITALIGPNGAGKTTVFNCITGFYKPTTGLLRLTHDNGRTFLLERLFDYRVSKTAKVARTFQNIRLFAGMTALENLMVAQHNVLMRASGLTFLGLIGAPTFRRAEQRAIEKAKYWLDRIGLTPRADEAAGNLPYSAINAASRSRARCAPQPALLCLDEPAAGLNAREGAALSELLLSIRKDHGTSILLIEHDMSVVMEIADCILSCSTTA